MSVSCMGGFCDRREGCAYYAPKPQAIPVERLCEPKSTECYTPIPIYWKQREAA